MSEDPREGYTGVNALMASIGQAFDLQAEVAARAVETGEIVLSMDRDEKGRPFVLATTGDRSVRIYRGAVRPAPDDRGDDKA